MRQQAAPGGAASQAEGLGQTPKGNGVALPGEGSTSRTGGGSVYMTPPTGSAQRPAVSLHLAKPHYIGSLLLPLVPGCTACIQAAKRTCILNASSHCLGTVFLATLTTGSCQSASTQALSKLLSVDVKHAKPASAPLGNTESCYLLAVTHKAKQSSSGGHSCFSATAASDNRQKITAACTQQGSCCDR